MPNPLELLEAKYGTVKKKVDIDPLISLEQKYNISPLPTAKDPLEVLEKKYAVRPTFADRLRPITERITPTLTKIAKWTGLAPLLPIAHPRVAKLFKEPAELFAAKYTKIEQAPEKAIARRLGFKDAREAIEAFPKIPDTIGGIPKWLVIPKLFPKPTNPVIKKYMPEAYLQLADFETEFQRQLGIYIYQYLTSPTVWALWSIPIAFRVGGFKLQQRLTFNKQTLLRDIMDESAKRMIPFVQNKYPSMSVTQAKAISEEWLARFFSQELGKIGGLKEVSYLKMLRFAKKLSKSSYPFVKDWKPPKPHYEFIKGHITGKAPSPAEAKYATELKRIAITSTRAPGRMAPPIAPPTEVPKPPVAPVTPKPEVVPPAVAPPEVTAPPEEIKLTKVKAKAPTLKPAKVESVTNIAQKIIQKRPQIPVLGNVLIENGNLIATDLETAYIAKIDKPDGLYKFIGKNLEKNPFDKREDFPEVPRPDIDVGTISSRQELITNLERALRSVSKDETRYVITGPLLNVEKGKGEIVATDGRRLSTSDIAVENFKDGKYIIASPKKVINALKGISGESLTAKTDKDKNYLSFEGDNGLVVSRLIEGDYPSYTKVFPTPNQQYIVNKSEIEQALKQLEPYASAEKDWAKRDMVKIEQQKENLVLTGGQKKISIPVEVRYVSYTPTKGTIVMPKRDGPGDRLFNPRYLIDAIKNVKGEKVFIGLNKAKTTEPFHIYGEDLSKVYPTKVAKPTVPKKEIPKEIAPPEVKIPPQFMPYYSIAGKPKIESMKMKPGIGAGVVITGEHDVAKNLIRAVDSSDAPHELGHLIDEKFHISDSPEWKKIAMQEGHAYLTTIPMEEELIFEDFASSFVRFVKEPDKFKKLFPQKHRYLESFFATQAKPEVTPPVKPTTPEEEVMMNGGEEIEDYEAGGQQFPPTEEIVRRQAYEKHIMQCLKSLAEMAPKDMVTNKQKALAHILAQKKKLTTRQLHRLEKIISGLTTMGPLTPKGRLKKTYMTKQQAGELIKALHKFFVPAYKKPSIPRGKLTAKDLQVIKTDLMKKPMRRVDVARLIKNARKVIRDPQFRPHFVNAYWEWVSSLKETAIGPKVLSMDVWSPRIEKRTGLPIYSGIYLPFEDAARGLKVETMGFWKEVEGIWGSHLKSPEPEDGDLALRVHHALIGDEEYFVDAPLTSEELKIVEKCREFYDKYFTEFDIGHYQDYYSPRIRQSGGVKVAYAGRIPKELRFAAELERVGLLSPSIEDERILMRIYFYAGARKKHYGPVLKQASEIKRFLPPNTLDAVDGYIGQKLGYGTKGQRVLEKSMENIMQSLKIELGPPQLLTALYFSSLYGGALGFRLHPIIRNSFQTFLMGYPEYGKWLAPGLKRSFMSGGISKWRNKGLLVDWGVPYGEEIDRAIEGVGSNAERLINLYRKIVRVGLIPYGKWIDTLNRANMANACDARFNHWLKKYKDGKISLKRFAKKINLKGEDDFVQREVINHIQNKDYEKALDRLIMVGIDNTQWPYRKGVGPQFGYGLGKFFSTFWVWPHRYAETLVGKWIARRQWGKIWRWLLVGYAMKKLGDKLKVSVLKWVHLGPLAISLTPAINTFYHFAGIAKAASWGNRREKDEHIRDFVRSAPVFIGYGIFARNIYEFLKAAGNNFVYYDKRGRYKFKLTPTEALLRAGGFTPKGLQERRKITGRFYNEEYMLKKAKRDIKDMFQTGRHKEARKNYRKFVRRYKEVYVPLYKVYVRKYGRDYMKRTGKEVPMINPFIMTELEGIREQK